MTLVDFDNIEHVIIAVYAVYIVLHDCTPPSMDHILIQKISPIHHLRTTNTVTVTRFNTYLVKKSIAFIASIVWNLLTPDLAKTPNVKNYIRMA